jgi:hypothetical protein
MDKVKDTFFKKRQKRTKAMDLPEAQGSLGSNFALERSGQRSDRSGCLLSRGKGSGRAEEGNENGSSLHGVKLLVL